MPPIYLHVGCGDRKFDGFINIDLDSPVADMHLDLTKPLPWEQSTVSGIYSEHFIEHITQAQAIRLMMEMRRVLVPGGVIRLATPDMMAITKEYLSGEVNPDWYNFHLGWTENQCERLNMAMRWWGHQWIYDEEEMTRLAIMAGLKPTGRYEMGQSPHAFFQNREYRQGSTLIMEFTKPDRQVPATENPLVSIAIPAYNPTYFRQCLESAVNQTYRNLEIIISDDCPSDNIQRITSEFAEYDNRIKYARNPSEDAGKDLGHSNYIASAQRSTGEFLKFLNDDDYLHPDCVSRMVDAFRKYPDISLVTSKRQRVDGSNQFLPDIPATQSPVNQDSLIDGLSLGRAVIASRLNFIGEPTTAMFRKSDILEMKPDFFCMDKQQMKGISDIALWLNLMTKGNVIYLTDTLSYFRCHPAQVQVAAIGQMQESIQRGWYTIIQSWNRRGLLQD